MTMSCRETRENLGAYLNQTLPENEARQVAENVAECPACAGALADQRHMREALAAHCPVPPPSRGFEARVLAAAAAGSGARWSHRALVGAVAAALVFGVALGVAWQRQGALQPAPEASAPVVSAPVEQTVRLAFHSGQRLEGVTLTLELPPNVELAHWPGQHRLSWQVDLEAGDNVLALPLKVLFPGSGELVARLNLGQQHKSFRVEIPGVGTDTGGDPAS